MTVQTIAAADADNTQDDDLAAVYGNAVDALTDLTHLAQRRRDFQPWHHPVKQVVRHHQWAALTKKLLDSRGENLPTVLQYFTLPGPDLMDVRVLADVCGPMGVKVEYFGFNSGMSSNATEAAQPAHVATWIDAESALRQADRITASSEVLADRLEDIALEKSHAATKLGLRDTFDVINIDACDHLAYSPEGRDRCTFDAIKVLLKHQMRARRPWLLFVTTRVAPSLIGAPGDDFKAAVANNLGVAGSGFGDALADCLGVARAELEGALDAAWATHDARFLKLFSIGLGKFLLQAFLQPNLPSNVELASLYAYRVHSGDHPDMLAMAFRVTPGDIQMLPPSTGGLASVPDLEPSRAIQVAKQAVKLQDLDNEMQLDPPLTQLAITGMRLLLQAGNYDLDEWRHWLAEHPQRPMILTD